MQPSNHLLSSQVQCVNVLAPMMKDPDALKRLFTPWSAEVIPFAPEGGEALTFEWTGLDNYLGEYGIEGEIGHRRKATSADAPFRFINNDGEIEIALVEWKYVEAYPDTGEEPLPARRLARYRAAGEKELDLTLVPFEDLFVEPVYQLMRLQLLAAGIEAVNEQGCRCVRLVHVAPEGNRELLRNLPRASLRSLGECLY